MESPVKSKCRLEKIANYAFISLMVILVGLMLFQCIGLCVDYYNQPVTTNIYVDDVEQIAFMPNLQFCFTRRHLLNFTRAQLLGLNESHQYYLLNYFVFTGSQSKMIPAGQFDDTNQTSLEAYASKLFDGWSKIEDDLVRAAETFLNSNSPMEFWNLNQMNNVAPLRFNYDRINTSAIFGPYTTTSSLLICYDIPSFRVPDRNDSVRFKFDFSIYRANAIGSSFAYVTPYRGDARVFEDDEYYAVDYAKDPDKQLTSLWIEHSVSIKKWAGIDRRSRKCIKDDEVLII